MKWRRIEGGHGNRKKGKGAALSMAAAVVMLVCGTAWGGDFSVSPVRLFFDASSRSGTVTVSNDGREPLKAEVRAMVWTQDAEGKDRYEETSDIVFFPKIFTLEAGKDRVIRAGIGAQPPGEAEKTYRLYIEEIPGQRKPSAGAAVAIAVRFGVPLFAKPADEKISGSVRDITLSGGRMGATVQNGGNVHFRIESVTFTGVGGKGEELFMKEESGWYLLNGVSRRYDSVMPEKGCYGIKKLRVKVITDRFETGGEIDVDQELCDKKGTPVS